MVSGMAAQRKKNTGREISGRLLSMESVLSIYSLDPDELYLPSQVATRITTEPVRRKKLAHRLRNWIKYHCHDPEGKVGSHNAWYGSTWQSFIDDADLERASTVVAFSELLSQRVLYLKGKEQQLQSVFERVERVEPVIPVDFGATHSTPPKRLFWHASLWLLAACLLLFLSSDGWHKEVDPVYGDLASLFDSVDAIDMPDIATFTDMLMEDFMEMKPRRIVSPDLAGDDDFLSMVFPKVPDGALFPLRIPDTLTPVPVL